MEKKQNTKLKVMEKILAVIIIILISLISFVGIFVKNKGSIKNIVPQYILGMDLYGSRSVIVKVDDGTEIKKYDSEGNLITEDEESEENTSDLEINEVEEPINSEESITLDNYKKTKEIIEKRLEYMKINNYLIRLNETDGTISIDVPENDNTDYVSQYFITVGRFQISDNETSEVLLSNSDIEKATVQYNTTSQGTTVYLSIQFNKTGAEKLKQVSNTYIKSEDEEGNETTKNIKMTLDNQTIMSTYFAEEITNGMIQLSIGTSSEATEIQNYLEQASNIAVFLNTEPMPITYKMEINRFVYSDITVDTLKVLIIVLVLVAIIMAIYLIFKFRKNGIFASIVNIGFVAILLLAIRLGNVTLSLSGIFAVVIAELIEYFITIKLLNKYKDSDNKEILTKNIKKELRKILIYLIPIAIMAVTFAVINWEEIASVGMVLFWAILIMLIYNILIPSIGIYEIENKEKNLKNKNKNEENKKRDNKKTKNKKKDKDTKNK